MYFTIYRDIQGYWRWTLKATNHETIAVSSEGYVSKIDCTNAIVLVKSAGSAPVYEG